MRIIYNKNKLLLVVALVVAGWFYVPRIFKLITYKNTTGVYLNHTIENRKVNSRNGRTYTESIYTPVVRIEVDGKRYHFISNHFLHDEADIGHEVPVKYNKHNPSKAFVNTFLGYWGPPLLYVIPAIVVAAGLILAFGMRIAAEKDRKIEDSGIVIEVQGAV